MKLVTSRLVLRPAVADDAPRFAEILGNWSVIRMVRLAPYPYSEALALAWIKTHEIERLAGTAFRFVIEAEGRMIGTCDLDEIDGERGDLGFWLDEAVWGRGIAIEAARAVVALGFNDLRLRRLTSGRAADNARSARVLERLGFREVSRTRVWSNPRGGEIDQCRYEMRRDEFVPRP
jgi:[ribosomal protein S5]-alanine N-acetyltransferase